MGKIAKALVGEEKGGSVHGGATAATMNLFVDAINLDFKEEQIENEAKQLGLGYANLRMLPVNTDALRMITREEAEQYGAVLYFVMGLRVKLGSPHPMSASVQELKSLLEKRDITVDLALISEESYHYALTLYQANKIITHQSFRPRYNEQEVKAFEKEVQELQQLRTTIETTPVADAMNMILFAAVKMGASDVHIQPEEERLVIRFRVDGVLHTVLELAKNMFARLSMQLKFQSQMKMNVAGKPQDGKFKFTMENKNIDLRVSFLPTEFGESIVLRLLDAEKSIHSFDELGFLGYNAHFLEYALKKPYGIILMSGPTGSGKTTTLYSILHSLNTPDVKIITLEDPIEYHLPNISQSQIREGDGYTFADGLRSVLRQDPDIIMVGEMRDHETAQIAVQAALTGHLVFSTVHTNSAVESLPRLMNMGIQPFLLGPALDAIIAQRLVRRVCSYCTHAEAPTAEELSFFEQTVRAIGQYHKGFVMDYPKEVCRVKGCERCNGTGYKGQIAVVEVLVVSDIMRDLMNKQVSQQVLFDQARRDGLITMREDGFVKVMQGLTTVEEVMRVAV